MLPAVQVWLPHRCRSYMEGSVFTGGSSRTRNTGSSSWSSTTVLLNGVDNVVSVIVVANFARVPKRRPKFNSRTIYERDGGRCQYTGRDLAPGEGNIDHVMPRSRGGATDWENCVIAATEVNSRKANRTPEEAGLKLRREPQAPREVPVTALLKNIHGISDWEPFLM